MERCSRDEGDMTGATGHSLRTQSLISTGMCIVRRSDQQVLDKTTVNRTYLLREKSASVVAIEIKKGPVFPGSNVAGMMVKISSSEVLSNMNPGGVDTSWVGTIGDPSYGRP